MATESVEESASTKPMAGTLLGGLPPNTKLIDGVGESDFFTFFCQKNLEIQSFIIIFAVAFRIKSKETITKT